jgi:hypothetical protein
VRRRASDFVFALLVAASLGLAILAVLVATGHFVTSDMQEVPTQPAATKPRASRPPPPPEPPASQRHVSRARRPAAGTPHAVSVVISASRGDCWVSAHRGSATGPVLAERVLTAGSTLSLRAPRIWLELGAAGNVDISVDGKPHDVPSGTTQIVLG